MLNTGTQVVGSWFMFGIIVLSIKCYQANKQFKREQVYDGYDCPVSETAFRITGVSSKTECIKICSDRRECKSVFFANHSSTILCHGCSNIYNNTLNLGRLDDSIYFKLCKLFFFFLFEHPYVFFL